MTPEQERWVDEGISRDLSEISDLKAKLEEAIGVIRFYSGEGFRSSSELRRFAFQDDGEKARDFLRSVAAPAGKKVRGE